jgi:hypothetical protein
MNRPIVRALLLVLAVGAIFVVVFAGRHRWVGAAILLVLWPAIFVGARRAWKRHAPAEGVAFSLLAAIGAGLVLLFAVIVAIVLTVHPDG